MKKKRKWSVKKKILIGAVIIVCIPIVYWIAFYVDAIIIGITTPIDIRKVHGNVSISIIPTENAGAEEEKDLVYYNHFEEAIRDESYIDGTPHFCDVKLQEIARIERPPFVIILCYAEEDDCVVRYVFQMKDNQYSQVLGLHTTELNQKEFLNDNEDRLIGRYYYDEEDCVTWDIEMALIFWGISGYNNGIPFYEGSSADERIKNLTILGQAPTEIIPIKHKGKMHYFWYYDDLQVADVMNENIDFSDYTYQQMIDCLQISLGD